jgi:transposase
MGNQLRMAQIEAIQTLLSRGWSQRRIARELGVHRDTVARYMEPGRREGVSDPSASGGLPDSKPAISIPGSECEIDSKPAISIPGSTPAECALVNAKAGRQSLCALLHETILEKLEAGLSGQRIYQDLVSDQSFAGSYSSVRRFVQRHNKQGTLPFRRMECAPGAEAQIDFGSGASIIDAEGKRRRTHVLRIGLSHSRKAYSESVFRQTTDDFLACIENGFWAWGGVPRTLVIDNLKAAVTQADWYDPELNPKLVAFCTHYGTVLLPTKPYTPRHKGKIESGIKYVKNNALKSRTFESLAAQNDCLAQWESRVADQRIHGTTKKQVRQVFESIERPALLPLPAERFPNFQEAQRVVHRDGHVEVAKAYYSVPPEYVGRTVWARWDSRIVRVFNDAFKQLAIHARSEAGCFSTDPLHLSSRKISGVERGATALLHRARLIGPQTGRWAESMLKGRGIAGVRVLVGLLSLSRKHLSSAIEKACEQASGCGAYRLRELRALMKEPTEQAQLEFMDEHPIIRGMSDYGAVVGVSFREGNPWKEPALNVPEVAADGSDA